MTAILRPKQLMQYNRVIVCEWSSVRIARWPRQRYARSWRAHGVARRGGTRRRACGAASKSPQAAARAGGAAAPARCGGCGASSTDSRSRTRRARSSPPTAPTPPPRAPRASPATRSYEWNQLLIDVITQLPQGNTSIPATYTVGIAYKETIQYI